MSRSRDPGVRTRASALARTKQALGSLALALGCALPGLAAATAGEASDAEPVVLAFTGADIRTATGARFSPGTLIVTGGTITAVGPSDAVAVPERARVHDASGKVIIPGLVDTHSHIGILSRPAVAMNYDGNELSGPLKSELRAIDAIRPDDPGIRMATAGGITTANVMPGSANLMGGQTAYVKLRGASIEEMLIHELGGERPVGGLKMANGENPKSAYAGKAGPGTRMAIVAEQRKRFLEAREYEKKWKGYEAKLETAEAGEEPDEPARDLALEPVVEVLAGERSVHYHTHRADDIASVLRLREEFGFDLVLQHATESYKLADRIAEAAVPVSLIATDSPGGKFEFRDYRREAAGLLERAGVDVAIHTDDPISSSRLFLRAGAMAVRGGMSEAGALRALTLAGARMLRLGDRVGSLEAGKDADFVVLSGPPFSVYTHVLETWIEGERVFDRGDPAQRRFATGGFELGDAYPDRVGADGEGQGAR